MITRLAHGIALCAIAAATLTAATQAPQSLAAVHRTLRFAPIAAHLGTPHSGYNQNGGNWSGYAASGTGFRSVVSHWVEPRVTCNSRNDLFAPWVGIDGYSSTTVEQTGVATDCSSGHPVYQGWYEMYPASPVYYGKPVSAGDAITASVTRSGTTYTLKLIDSTKGWTKTTVKTFAGTNTSAEVIMESPTADYPNFGRVNFSGSRVNGNTLGSTHPTALDASNSHGYEDHTSALTNGTAFYIKYLRE